MSYKLGWPYLVPLAIVVAGYRARFLSVSGSCGALLVGCLVVEAGWREAAMLIAFFLSGSIATKIKQREKDAAMPYPETEEEAKEREKARRHKDDDDDPSADEPVAAAGAVAPVAVQRHGRDIYQVFATGLIPALICACRAYFPSLTVDSSSPIDASSLRAPYYLAYLAYLACCCGDTLASEIGMLATQVPIMIVGKKRVARGIDGGMTFVGTAASVLGGMLVGAFGGSLSDIFLGGVFGCLGAFFDSLLGAVTQSPQYALATATPGTAVVRDQDGFFDGVSSPPSLPLTATRWKQLNNVINLLSSLMTCVLALGAQHLLIQYDIDLRPLMAFVCLLLLLTLAPGLSPRGAMSVAGVAVMAVFPEAARMQLGVALFLYAAWRTN